MKIAIGAITRMRPKMGLKCIQSISQLNVPKEIEPVFILVENDESASLRDIFEIEKKQIPFKAIYDVEPKVGIPFARNRVVEKANACGAELLLFFDDDMTLQSSWLAEHFKAYQKYKAQLQVGNTEFIFPEATPNWMISGRFFEGVKLMEGQNLVVAPTRNLLIELDFINKHKIRFDERFALTGGSDMFLTKQVISCGGEVVYTDKSIAYEELPSSRISLKWILLRQYRYANNNCFYKRLTQNIYQTTKWLTSLVIKHSVKGFVSIIWGVLSLNKVRLVYGLRHFFIVAGTVGCLVGRRYEEYKNIHGS